MAPILATHLKSLGYSTEEIGMIIGVPAICYIVFSLFIYLLEKCLPKRGIICLGLCNISIAMLLIGESKHLNSERPALFILIGLMFMGISSGMISILALPEMLEVFESDPDLVSRFDKESV